MALYDDILRESMMAGRAARRIGMEDDLMGTSVVPPLYSQYNPAGAYAEAGRTVPNYASDWARGMNQVTQPFGGIPEDLHSGGAPAYYKDKPFYEEQIPYFGTDPNLVRGMREGQSPTGFDYSSLPAYGDASVVQRLGKLPTQRIPTERELMVSTQEGVENSDRAFSRLHSMWAQGHPFFDLDAREAAISGAEGYGTEGVGELPEFTEIYLQVPDEAKRYAHANKHDPKVLAQFEEKYGFPLDVSVEITGSGWEDYQTR